MNDPLVCVDGVGKAFGVRSLWTELTFDVWEKEMIAVTGVSGSGKSTLLNCIGVLEAVDTGSICVDGCDITTMGSRAKRLYRRDTLGYLFQDYALIDNVSVWENLRIAVPIGLKRVEQRARMADALERVGLSGRGPDPTYQLSGGEQQRVALARLLVKKPRVVLADEPTGALDEGNSEMVVDAMRAFANNGACVIVATHNRDVEQACDRSIHLA